MNERFRIMEFCICTFDKTNEFYRPNINDYPRRLCVIDNDNGLVIDIEHGLKYDYIETINGKYAINNSLSKVESGKRSAIFPIVAFNVDNRTMSKALKIVERLKKNETFLDGNDVLNNEEYLKKVIKDEQSFQKKLSRFFKKGK